MWQTALVGQLSGQLLDAHKYSDSLIDWWYCKCNNAKSTKYANTIGSSSGEDNITEMWRTHFEQLYNSVNDNGFKALCYDRLENSTSNDSPYVITVHNVLECVSKQKTRKAVGLDGIAMETIINGGYKLTVHLSLLFNLLIQLRYLPNSLPPPKWPILCRVGR